MSTNKKEEVPAVRVLTQETFIEQLKGVFVLRAGQLEELTRLVQGMVTKPNPSFYSKAADYTAISGAVEQQPDMVTGATRTMNRRQQRISSPDIDDEASYKE